MREKVIDFIKSTTNATENTNIMYRPVEYRSLIEDIPFWDLVQMIENDFTDLKSYIPEEKQNDEKLLQCIFNNYKKHFVVL